MVIDRKETDSNNQTVDSNTSRVKDSKHSNLTAAFKGQSTEKLHDSKTYSNNSITAIVAESNRNNSIESCMVNKPKEKVNPAVENYKNAQTSHLTYNPHSTG